jgi:hypothetical protein
MTQAPISMIFSRQTSWAPVSVPERRYVQMLAQPVIPWTPTRMMQASWQWLMAETNDQGTVTISKG